MGMMRMANKTGDLRVEWDPKDDKSVAHARTLYQREVRDGKGTAFRIVEGGTGERLEAFDQDAAEIVIVPRIQGG